MNTKTKSSTARFVASVIIGLIMVVAIMAVHDASFQDELAYYDHTCQMIDAGHWPAEVEPSCGVRHD